MEEFGGSAYNDRSDCGSQSFWHRGAEYRLVAIIVTSGIKSRDFAGRFFSAKKRAIPFEMLIDLISFWPCPWPLSLPGFITLSLNGNVMPRDFVKDHCHLGRGAHIYGGVIGALPCSFGFSANGRKVPSAIFWISAHPVWIFGAGDWPLGQFCNQEAFGNVITNPSMQWFPYGVYIERLGEWHQATFFYESAWNLIVLAVLLWYWKRAKHKGQCLCHVSGDVWHRPLFSSKGCGRTASGWFRRYPRLAAPERSARHRRHHLSGRHVYQAC